MITDTILIKAERLRRGWSFRQAALAAGWPRDYASRWERVESGECIDPAFSTVIGIADAFGWPVDFLRAQRPGHVLQAMAEHLMADTGGMEGGGPLTAAITRSGETLTPPVTVTGG
jgi:transcriptional regulator with XRE-family HTH domain